MKVLFVIGSLELGGAESQMVLLIEYLAKSGHECHVFSMGGNGPLSERLKAARATVIDGGYQSGPGKIWLVRQLSRSWLRLNRAIWKHRYDVVHAFLPLANFLASVTRLTCRVPLLLTSRRALGTHQDRFPLWKHFDRVANHLTDVITVNSVAVRDDVVMRDGVPEDKLRLIYNGIEIQPFNEATACREKKRAELSLRPNEVALVMVANLIPYKGHKDVIDAVAMLEDEVPDLRLFFVGEDRGLQGKLEERSVACGLKEKVAFLGQRKDVPELLAAMDIGVIASHEEGFCNALLEMMASELPVVATRVGGNAEALGHGRYGILVEARKPDQIANALSLMLGEAAVRMSYSRGSASFVRSRFTPEVMLKEYLALYSASS